MQLPRQALFLARTRMQHPPRPFFLDRHVGVFEQAFGKTVGFRRKHWHGSESPHASEIPKAISAPNLALFLQRQSATSEEAPFGQI
jgi:hypothetical protein